MHTSLYTSLHPSTSSHTSLHTCLYPLALHPTPHHHPSFIGFVVLAKRGALPPSLSRRLPAALRPARYRGQDAASSRGIWVPAESPLYAHVQMYAARALALALTLALALSLTPAPALTLALTLARTLALALALALPPHTNLDLPEPRP